MEAIFSTLERVKILTEIVFKTGAIGVNQVANQLKLSKGLVSKYFGILMRKGIIKKEGTKYLIIDNALLKGVKVLLNISIIPVKILKKFKFIKSAGLFGSCARGENTEYSDFDIWIFYDNAKDEELARFSSEISEYLHNLNILFLTRSKLKELKSKENLFYNSILFGSIILYGDINAIHL